MNKSLAYSLIIVAFLTGGGLGYFFTPSYREVKTPGAVHGSYTDEAYLKGLQGHHLQAVFLAEQGKSYGSHPEIQTLSATILATMPAKIDQLAIWRKTWFRDESNPEPELINLGTADSNFDLRWLNALDFHHKEAISMAQGALSSSIRNDVLTLSSEIVRVDKVDLKTFAQWRELWFSPE